MVNCTMHSWYEYDREEFDWGYKKGFTCTYKCRNCDEILERFHEEYEKGWY